jgi:phage shock protein A
MEDSDLSGLDLEAAREYIFAYAVDIKRLDRDIADSGTELERWKDRVALAEGKLAGAAGVAAADPSMAAMAEAARAKVAEAEGKLGSLEAERSDLRAKVAGMRAQLPMIKARERSIDPDRLLAELQLMTGELLNDASGGRSAAATEADFAKLEANAKADAELEALKRRSEVDS